MIGFVPCFVCVNVFESEVGAYIYAWDVFLYEWDHSLCACGVWQSGEYEVYGLVDCWVYVYVYVVQVREYF